MKKKLIILGAGQMGRAAQTLLSANQVEVAAFGDNSPKAWNRDASPAVLPVEEALALSPDLVLIGILDEGRCGQLEGQARELGYTGPVLKLGDLFSSFDLRSATLRRLVERIEAVPGDLAELGVFRGDFAWQINALFPDRTFHLFDTFEGFDPRDTCLEAIKPSGPHVPDFSDTCVEAVMARMPHPEQIVLHQGYFPDSLNGLETKFALVSLDPDLYAPTLAGLRYFYPRMNPGGVILIHDYNNRQFTGVKKAVSEYEAEHGRLLLIPLVDLHGTAAIIHP